MNKMGLKKAIIGYGSATLIGIIVAILWIIRVEQINKRITHEQVSNSIEFIK